MFRHFDKVTFDVCDVSELSYSEHACLYRGLLEFRLKSGSIPSFLHMYSDFKYMLLVLTDYIFASEIERFLFRKMRSLSIIQQLICVTNLVVLRPINVYPFLSIRFALIGTSVTV